MGEERSLYDLAAEPGEEKNLLDRHPETTAGLEAKLRAWKTSIGDKG